MWCLIPVKILTICVAAIGFDLTVTGLLALASKKVLVSFVSLSCCLYGIQAR